MDEREHEQAEWGSMFEEADEDDDDEDDSDEGQFADITDDEEEEEEEEEGKPEVMADAGDEVEKGAAIKKQLQVWEKLLETRIQLHKVLMRANRLPRPDSWSAFAEAGDQEHSKSTKRAQTAIVGMLDDLLELKTAMINSNGALKRHYLKQDDADSDDLEEELTVEVPSKKQKIKSYSKHLATSSESMEPYRNSVIKKWNDKTRLASGGGGGKKSFAAFEQHTSTLQQIDFILSDKSRLVARTKSKRSEYSVLGEPKQQVEDDEDDAKVDEEVFDDDDFYHQLLKELIERRTADVSDPTQLGRQWLQIQKMRSKAKRGKVDTRASKGRKTRYCYCINKFATDIIFSTFYRYDIHAKLINFMAPENSTKWWKDEARNELFSSLFGKASGVGAVTTAEEES